MSKKKSPQPTTAVALHYDGKNAPQVTAKLELGDEIPQALYLAVAEVIAFAYLLSGKRPEEK